MHRHRDAVPKRLIIQQRDRIEQPHLYEVRQQRDFPPPQPRHRQPSHGALVRGRDGEELGEAVDGDGEELGEGDERAGVGVRARELLKREGVAVRRLSL